MAKAQEIGLSADDSYAEAAARTIAVRADELVEHSSGVLDTAAIEHLHDMRVATRRLRAALEVFEPCFPAKPYRRELRDVKQLADALGERRDRDVTIAGLRGFGTEMPSADQRGINALVEVLGAEQRQANDRLAPMVAFEQVEELRAALLELAASARPEPEPELEPEPEPEVSGAEYGAFPQADATSEPSSGNGPPESAPAS